MLGTGLGGVSVIVIVIVVNVVMRKRGRTKSVLLNAQIKSFEGPTYPSAQNSVS
jgi:hypothetical protein